MPYSLGLHVQNLYLCVRELGRQELASLGFVWCPFVTYKLGGAKPKLDIPYLADFGHEDERKKRGKV